MVETFCGYETSADKVGWEAARLVVLVSIPLSSQRLLELQKVVGQASWFGDVEKMKRTVPSIT